MQKRHFFKGTLEDCTKEKERFINNFGGKISRVELFPNGNDHFLYVFCDDISDSDIDKIKEPPNYLDQYKNKSESEVYGKSLSAVTGEEAREFLNGFHVREQDIKILTSKAFQCNR
jgi:hypothetical protein